MENNPYIEEIEKMIREEKLFILGKVDSKYRVVGYNIIATKEQNDVVRHLVNKELRKIPKWVRKIWKIKQE